jgi:hypothetical protein
MSLKDYIYFRVLLIGMPTLYRVKALENFLKGVTKDNFRILFTTSLKTKGGTKGKIFNL